MPSPAFLVEGQMEQKIIARLCPGQPVRRIGANGDHVAIAAICDRVETLIRLFGNKHYPIIVIFDREKREADCDHISNTVVSTLHHRGLNDHDIRVFIADREFEDWILKDPDSICQHFDIPKPTNIGKGKSGLAKLIEPACQYHETTIGVELFSIVSKAIIRDQCHIFARLHETATEIGCPAFG